MKNINNTDYFLLAHDDLEQNRSASTPELVGLTLAVIAVVAAAALLI